MTNCNMNAMKTYVQYNTVTPTHEWMIKRVESQGERAGAWSL